MKSSLLTFFLSRILGTTFAHGAVHNVVSGQDLQSVIDSASSGDQIRLLSATYGDIEISTKDLSFKSTGATPAFLGNVKITGSNVEFIRVGASTLEARAALERAIERDPISPGHGHPGLLHFYIHLMEMSPHPERALRASDALRSLVPDAGHIHHMPSHIYSRLNRYEDAVWHQEASARIDNKQLARDRVLPDEIFNFVHNIQTSVPPVPFVQISKNNISAFAGQKN